ncbi:TonB-dependent receptor domain-containing protein [Pontibacter cellulosilyticus]|uniref:TonB-dependent receptor n=1 Tax=Pontibacter cellulosilyticus TaxID=1720253 RepID=A0A923SNJ1_9BACT|nr:TonB-dependent receptor [Pontibacter cellulosilyticus]MBC5993250.1 TonB-dependent receptor [Pontibacter cellulosilyticus]
MYLSFHTAYAQTSKAFLSIKGTIVDSVSQKTLSYVTVIIVERSQVVRTTLSYDDGTFTLSELPNLQYQLTISYLGYKTKTLTLPSSTSPTVDLGTIILTPTATELDEVQITTLRPLIEQSFDRTIYNVDADPEANSLSTLDMLRKVPYLTIDAEDNLQLKGSNSYQILVNGKRSALFAGNPSEIFKTLPANSIKKVEVITNPSARYEASGIGGIINIVTHKKSISGYNGSINLTGDSPEGYTAGSFLSATAGKFSFSGRYNYRHSESPPNSSSFYRNDFINNSKLKQTSIRTSKSSSQNLGSEISYQLSPQDIITANYSQYSSNNTSNFTQLAKQTNAIGALTQSFQNLNYGKSESTGQDVSLDYEHSFKKSDQQLLSFSFNSTTSNSSNNSDLTIKPIVNYTGRVSVATNENNTKERIIQVDYVHPIGKQSLEVGARSMFEKSTSNYFFKTRDEETGYFLPDPSMSNSFSYNQDVHAAYISFNLTTGKWGLITGGRIERTKLDANFRSSGTSVSKSYLSLFPNVTLSRALKENSRINLSYSQRIDRPGLYSLDPYVDQTDPLNISFGNPDLDPATSHAFQAEYSTYYKATSFNLNATHTFTNNSIEQLTILGKDSVARNTFGNIGQNRNYGLTLNGNTTLFKRLSLNLNAGANYVSYTSTLEGEPQTNEGFTYNLRGAANVRFGKGWRISGNLSYNSPNIILQGSSSGYSWSSLSINKQFLKNEKASIAFNVRSPFIKERRNLHETINPSFYQLRESFTVIRQFSLAFSYRFGKLR